MRFIVVKSVEADSIEEAIKLEKKTKVLSIELDANNDIEYKVGYGKH